MNASLVGVSLSDLGWTPYFQSQLVSLSSPLLPARIAVAHRGAYELLAAEPLPPARLSGRLRHALDGSTELPTTGDWVGIETHEGGSASIAHVFTRSTCLLRQASGTRTAPQVIAA